MDQGHKKLLVIDLKHKSFDYVKSLSAELKVPAGIWVMEKEYKYVTDFGRKQVVVFNDKDQLLMTMGRKVSWISHSTQPFMRIPYLCVISTFIRYCL
jgi:hypothetical protein